MRKHWLDNLRWLTILLVLLFHVVCFCNSCGMPLGVLPGVPVLDSLGYFCYPWFMGLLFLVAGISARYALKGLPVGQFVKKRSQRLLLPLALSLIFLGPLLVTVVWGIGGTGWGPMMDYFQNPIIVGLLALVAGMGSQWFLLVLFCISMLVLPFRGLGEVPAKGPLLLVLPGLLWWLATKALPAPERLVLYLLLFFVGYFMLASQEAQLWVKQYRWPLALGSLLTFILVLVKFWGQSFTDSAFLSHPITAAFGWLSVLAALGWGQVLLNCDTQQTRFWSRRGFALYLFHYLPLNAMALLLQDAGLPPLLNYGALLAASLLVPLLLYEICIRIRFLKCGFALRG